MNNANVEMLIRIPFWTTLMIHMNCCSRKETKISKLAHIRHRYSDSTTHDVIVMGSSDKPSTHLMVQTLTETLKKMD